MKCSACGCHQNDGVYCPECDSNVGVLCPLGTLGALRSLVTTVEALLHGKGVEHNAKALVREARAARVILGTTEEE